MLDPGRDENWRAEMRRVARNLNAETVDGSDARFVCEHCGREHVREANAVSSFELAVAPRS